MIKKNETFLLVSPLFVLAALALVTAGKQHADRVRRSRIIVSHRLGTFDKEIGSRVLLQKLSAQLKAFPDTNQFSMYWQTNTPLKGDSIEMTNLMLNYDRHLQILDQGPMGSGAFRYKVTEAAINSIAATDKTVVRLNPKNYTRVHIFTARQRLKHGIEILPPDTSGGQVTISPESKEKSTAR